MLVWRFEEPRLVASSCAVGGGVGLRWWILNAQVPLGYARTDLADHVRELATSADCRGEGVGMLTAASLERPGTAEERGVVCTATVGVSTPTWAADADDAVSVPVAGTINIVAELPVRLAPGALLNALITVTEAKSQALLERAVPGTGTASDAVCIVCPADGEEEPFAGPRSPWGARLARTTHAAVLGGLCG